MANDKVTIERGETPAFLFEFFQGEEGGPLVDLTGATITVTSNIPNATSLAYVMQSAVNGALVVELTEALTLGMQKFKEYWIKVSVRSTNGSLRNATMGISAQ